MISSVKDVTTSVMCDTAYNNSCLSNSCANRLDLQATASKLRIKGITTGEFIETKFIERTVTPRDNQSFEPFEICPYVKKYMNSVADVVNIKATHGSDPHQAVLDPVA